MKAIVYSIALLHLSACVHTVTREPPPPVLFDDSFSAAFEGPLSDRWWETFDNPRLNTMVAEVLSENFQMRAAWARLRQAEALATQAGAPLWPGLNAGVQGGRQRSVTAFGAGENNFFSLSLGASYEIDIWGKLRDGRLAGALNREATRDDTESLAMTLVAQVSDTWLSLAASRAQERLLGEQLDTNERYLELVTLRYKRGLTAAADIHQQRGRLEATRYQIAQVSSRREVLEHQLAVLLGKSPNAPLDFGSMNLPQLAEAPGLGLPSDLLTRRPDVRAAQRRVEAADARVGAALADMFPTLRLTGSVGFSATSLPDLLSDLIWNVVAGLTQPLFEGGRRKAEWDKSRAGLDERLNQFADTFLRAMLEVENALTVERRQRQALEHLKAQHEHAKAALRHARQQYTEGVSDFLLVLTALSSVQQVEQNLIDAQRQLVSNRIQLYRALGGSWTQTIEAYDPKEKTEAHDPQS